MKSDDILKCCSQCGGQNVRVDAWAHWDTQTQTWELHSTYNNSWCEDCDSECTIVDRAASYLVVDLPCGTEINWLGMGRRKIVDCHTRPAGMLLLVTTNGEFDIPAGQRIAAHEVVSAVPEWVRDGVPYSRDIHG